MTATSLRQQRPSRDRRRVGSGSNRVKRGGSFNNDAVNMRSAERNNNTPTNRNANIGARCLSPRHRPPPSGSRSGGPRTGIGHGPALRSRARRDAPRRPPARTNQQPPNRPPWPVPALRYARTGLETPHDEGGQRRLDRHARPTDVPYINRTRPPSRSSWLPSPKRNQRHSSKPTPLKAKGVEPRSFSNPRNRPSTLTNSRSRKSLYISDRTRSGGDRDRKWLEMGV